MSIVLAALDSTAAATAVLETAIQIGRLTGTDVAALHVRERPLESVESLELLAARAKVSFRVVEGSVKPALFDALNAPEVIAAVVGARATSGGQRPVGRTAAHIIENLDKPVVLVPPEVAAPISIRRILVPLEGAEASSRSVREQLRPLLVAEVELIVLHVFTEATLPTMLDRPYRDLEILGREFLIRHHPQATHIDLRLGPVAERVAEVSAEHGADLIVLSWSQDATAGRAQVIREVLRSSTLPVMLLPVTRTAHPPRACSE
ncbi:MAG TPA: universal stress protein [Acidimicrobiales bacterium]|nr:universal stress protein [Acidimicrobiales bacterium]